MSVEHFEPLTHLPNCKSLINTKHARHLKRCLPYWQMSQHSSIESIKVCQSIWGKKTVHVWSNQLPSCKTRLQSTQNLTWGWMVGTSMSGRITTFRACLFSRFSTVIENLAFHQPNNGVTHFYYFWEKLEKQSRCVSLLLLLNILMDNNLIIQNNYHDYVVMSQTYYVTTKK